jgi:hypothetical protein
MDNQNLLTIPRFAEKKETTRVRIYQLITKGVIVPTLIDNRQFIDMNIYGDFDVKARVKREASMAKMQLEINNLKRDVLNIRRVVFNGSENGEEKTYNHIK